jgi:hypothetical protein
MVNTKPVCKNGCSAGRWLNNGGYCIYCAIYFLQRKGRDYIKFTTQIDTSGTCWYWKGIKTDKGYGLFINETGQTEMAHRASYKHYRGPIGAGNVLDHLCRNPWCVNPNHLEAVSKEENRNRVFTPPVTIR